MKHTLLIVITALLMSAAEDPKPPATKPVFQLTAEQREELTAIEAAFFRHSAASSQATIQLEENKKKSDLAMQSLQREHTQTATRILKSLKAPDQCVITKAQTDDPSARLPWTVDCSKVPVAAPVAAPAGKGGAK